MATEQIKNKEKTFRQSFNNVLLNIKHYIDRKIPDWNENNAWAIQSYIKNRTHYKEEQIGSFSHDSSAEKEYTFITTAKDSDGVIYSSNVDYYDDGFIFFDSNKIGFNFINHSLNTNGDVTNVIVTINDKTLTVTDTTLSKSLSLSDGKNTDYLLSIVDNNNIILSWQNTSTSVSIFDTITISLPMYTYSQLDTYYTPGKYNLNQTGEVYNDYINNNSTGYYTHTEGSHTLASGHFSHAAGLSTSAIGKASTAIGEGTYANEDNELVLGQYNIKEPETKYVEVVGGGSDDDNRKNIYTLDWSGNADYAGNLKVEGTLETDKKVTFNDEIEVKKATTLDSTLNVTDTTALSSTLDVTGATTLKSTLNVSGVITAPDLVSSETSDSEGKTYITNLTETNGKVAYNKATVATSVTESDTNAVNGGAVYSAIKTAKEEAIQETTNLKNSLFGSGGTAKSISSYINALDMSAAVGTSDTDTTTNKYIKYINETDGKVEALAGDIKSTYSATSTEPINGVGVAAALTAYSAARFSKTTTSISFMSGTVEAGKTLTTSYTCTEAENYLPIGIINFSVYVDDVEQTDISIQSYTPYLYTSTSEDGNDYSTTLILSNSGSADFDLSTCKIQVTSLAIGYEGATEKTGLAIGTTSASILTL